VTANACLKPALTPPTSFAKLSLENDIMPVQAGDGTGTGGHYRDGSEESQ
jgi:hypothetical protein